MQCGLTDQFYFFGISNLVLDLAFFGSLERKSTKNKKALTGPKNVLA